MDYKDSEAYKEVQNNRLACKIAIAGFLVAHIICYIISRDRFGQVTKFPFLWAVPVLCIVSVALTVKNLLKGSEATELSPFPYIACLATTFFSCMVLFWCALC